MKPGSQVPRMAMYLNDKELSALAARVSVLHGFHGEGLDYFTFMCASVHKKARLFIKLEPRLGFFGFFKWQG